MIQIFFCFLMFFTAIKLLAIGNNNERPPAEEPAKKKFKSGSSINPSDFKEALHLLCALRFNLPLVFTIYLGSVDI